MTSTIRPFNTQIPTLGEGVYIDPCATVIGSVHLAKDVSIWPMSVVRGDVNAITIGEGSNIQDGSVIHGTHAGPYCPEGRAVVIGKRVTVGHKAILHACTIGDYCLIGMGAIVLDGVILENHVMIGAGSIVTTGKRLQSGYLYLGAPAQIIRKLTDAEIAQLHYSANYYIDLKNNYLNSLK